MRCKRTGHANFRRGGCISTVRFSTTITLTRLGLIPEIVVFMYTLLDERNLPPLGRIGDPDDIIASVRVQDGEVSFTSVDIDYPWSLNCDMRR